MEESRPRADEAAPSKTGGGRPRRLSRKEMKKLPLIIAAVISLTVLLVLNWK